MPEKPTSTIGALNQIVPSPSSLRSSAEGLHPLRSIHTMIVTTEGTVFTEITEHGVTGYVSTFAGGPLPKGTVITSAVGITDFEASAPVACYHND